MKKLLTIAALAALTGCASAPPQFGAPGAAPAGHSYTGGDYRAYPLCCAPEKGGDGT